MKICEMKAQIAMDDIKDADMLYGYALEAKAAGEIMAHDEFVQNIHQRLDRVGKYVDEMRKKI